MTTNSLYAQPPTGLRLTAVWLARLLIMGLLVFELANLIGPLGFPLEYTWLGLAMTTLAAFVAMTFLEYLLISKLGIYPHWSAWPLIFTMLMIDFSGDFFHLYGSWLPYDRLAHMLSGVILASLLYSLFNRISWAKKWRYPLSINLMLALGADILFAVSYEIEEYTEDILYHTSRLGNGFDTVNDLLMNLIGAATALTLVYFLTREPLAMAIEEPVLASRQVLPIKKRQPVSKLSKKKKLRETKRAA